MWKVPYQMCLFFWKVFFPNGKCNFRRCFLRAVSSSKLDESVELSSNCWDSIDFCWLSLFCMWFDCKAIDDVGSMGSTSAPWDLTRWLKTTLQKNKIKKERNEDNTIKPKQLRKHFQHYSLKLQYENERFTCTRDNVCVLFENKFRFNWSIFEWDCCW